MITVKNCLDEGIYPSEGGGETRTHYEFTTGPRNLLKAIEELCKLRALMERSYGNIGCGRSWLEIDGQVIHLYDLEEVARDAPDGITRTQKARELLAEVAAGRYEIKKYDY